MTSQLTEQPTGEAIDLNAGCPSNTENPGPRVCGVALRANPQVASTRPVLRAKLSAGRRLVVSITLDHSAGPVSLAIS